MAIFQTQIRNTLGVAKPGVIIEGASAYRKVDQCVTEDDTIVQGMIVRQGTTTDGVVSVGATPVIGVVVADEYFSGYELGTTARAGQQVTVLKRGCISILATTAATKNDKVLINDTTGEVTFGATATTGTTDTGWVVDEGCEANGIAFILK